MVSREAQGKMATRADIDKICRVWLTAHFKGDIAERSFSIDDIMQAFAVGHKTGEHSEAYWRETVLGAILISAPRYYRVQDNGSQESSALAYIRHLEELRNQVVLGLTPAIINTVQDTDCLDDIHRRADYCPESELRDPEITERPETPETTYQESQNSQAPMTS